jgi:FkbM family methyltransferase
VTETREELEARCLGGVGITGQSDTTARCTVLGNKPMVVDTRDKSVAPLMIRDGYWETWITLALKRALKPGDRFLDIGANMGWYCLVAAEAGATVVAAVEPGPRTADLLEETLKLNGIDAPVIRAAAWSRTGETLDLEQDPENLGGMSVRASRFPTVSVSSITIDDIAEQYGPIDVIKMDCEGSELEAWRGAQKTLSRPGVKCFMEFMAPFHEEPLAALREIEASGFPVTLIDFHGVSVPANLEAIAKLPDWVMLQIVTS